jgi:hypothetical protein
MAEVRSRPAGAGGKSTPTPEQCENMRALGYVGAGCKLAPAYGTRKVSALPGASKSSVRSPTWPVTR